MISFSDNFVGIQRVGSPHQDAYDPIRFSVCQWGLSPTTGARSFASGRYQQIPSNRNRRGVICAGVSFSPSLNLEADSFCPGREAGNTFDGNTLLFEISGWNSDLRGLERLRNIKRASKIIISVKSRIPKGLEALRYCRNHAALGRGMKDGGHLDGEGGQPVQKRSSPLPLKDLNMRFGYSKARVRSKTARRDSRERELGAERFNRPGGLRWLLAFPEARRAAGRAEGTLTESKLTSPFCSFPYQSFVNLSQVVKSTTLNLYDSRVPNADKERNHARPLQSNGTVRETGWDCHRSSVRLSRMRGKVPSDEGLYGARVRIPSI